MTPLQQATICLLGWPLRAASCMWKACIGLGAFVSFTVLAVVFLALFVLFPITLPLAYWLIVKGEKLDAISRADAKRKLDEHYGHLRRKIKRK